MRKRKPKPDRQRQLLFPVADREARLSVEARQRCRQLVVQLLGIVVQAERAARRHDDE
ncbi:MAG: hypothetical protein HW381_354 [Candidatus Rokubacteria bacterium]|jgi:hypothetical protein|nr:hypothetical protein [Candidatus Rokubacteria bacterium]